MKKPRSVDEYIARAPKAAQPVLRQLRKTIKAAAPQAEERISYGMPYYGFHGRLVYFAGYQHHCGLYMLPSAKALTKLLAKYRTSKATARFPLDKPLPVGLVRKVIQARVKENLARKK